MVSLGERVREPAAEAAAAPAGQLPQAMPEPVRPPGQNGAGEAAEAVEQLHLQPGSPGEPAGIKACSICAATDTPMWRNDAQGRKTLCNACGVRLSRKASRAKQDAASSAGEAPTSLLAGKQPRARARAAQAKRCGGSPEPLAPPPVRTASPTAQALSKRRRSGQLAGFPSAEPPSELDRASPPSRAQEPAQTAVELLLLPPHARAGQRVTNVRVALRQGQLRVELPNGSCAAACHRPEPLAPPRWAQQQQAWLWAGPRGFSLLLRTEAACEQFKGLLASWLPPPRADRPEPQAAQPRQPGGGLPAGPAGRRPANAEELQFLEEVRAHIAQSPGLAAHLSLDVYERLLDVLFKAQLQTPHPLSDNLVEKFCRQVPWAPSRVVVLIVLGFVRKRVQQDRQLAALELLRRRQQDVRAPLADSDPPAGCASATLSDALLDMPFAAAAPPVADLPPRQARASEAPVAPFPPLDLPLSLAPSPWAAAATQLPAAALLPLDDALLALDDPLDPRNLERISDPRQQRRSPGEDLSDQTTDLADGQPSLNTDMNIAFASAALAAPRLRLLPPDRLAFPLPPVGGPALRRAASFLGAPMAMGQTDSPTTPTSGGSAQRTLGVGGRHQSLPSLPLAALQLHTGGMLAAPPLHGAVVELPGHHSAPLGDECMFFGGYGRADA